ncbi:MAG: phosphoribosyltransferase [Steroidobacteraceae bacterium]
MRPEEGSTTTWHFEAGLTARRDWLTGGSELRPSLPFACCYVYAPHGEGVVSEGSRLVCERVKRSDPIWLPRYAGRVVELAVRAREFRGLFGRDVVLVPVPCSAPARPSSWSAWQLATALQALGLARSVWVGLQRQSPVRKSSTALVGERPTVREHYESFGVTGPPGVAADRIVLVDDVITKGRTLFAAAARMQDALPHADIRAFALIRTLGFLSRVDRLVAPCQGFVRWAGGDAKREP